MSHGSDSSSRDSPPSSTNSGSTFEYKPASTSSSYGSSSSVKWVKRSQLINDRDINNNHSPQSQYTDNGPIDYVMVCKFYCPYFKTGCNNSQCPYRHLSQSEFLEYVESQQLMNKHDFNKFKNGQRDFDKHRYEKCQRIFGSLSKKYPTNKEINIMLARMHEKKHNLDIAQHYYRRAISMDPNNATFHGRYACFSYKKTYNYDLAKRHFKQSLSLKNTLSVVHRDYGHYLQEIEHDLDSAEMHYLQCINIFERDDECHYFYALLLNETNRYKEAEQEFKKAIEYQYNRTRSYYFMYHYDFAFLLKKMHKFSESENQFRICIDIDPKHNIPHLMIGVIFCKRMMFEKGLKYIQQSLRLKRSKETKEIYDKMYQQYQERLREKERMKVKEGMVVMTEGKEKEKKEFLQNEIDDNKCNVYDDQLQLAQNMRQSEFERFMEGILNVFNEKKKKKINVSAYLDDFRQTTFNDIRLMGKFDTSVYLKALNVRNLVLFEKMKRKIDEFKMESCEFQKWLKQIGMGQYIAVFEKYGILTVEQFDRHINTLEDLQWLIGEQNIKHANIIWNSSYPYRE